jgi:hypothetical protein
MASKQGKRINSYQGPLTPVAHMEVRGRMIAVVHSNHNAEEAIDLRESTASLRGKERPRVGIPLLGVVGLERPAFLKRTLPQVPARIPTHPARTGLAGVSDPAQVARLVFGVTAVVPPHAVLYPTHMMPPPRPRPHHLRISLRDRRRSK